MRDRDDIEKDIPIPTSNEQVADRLLLEGLLDIRDQLADLQEVMRVMLYEVKGVM